MTILSAVASFAVVAGLLTIVPGLDMALVLRSAATHGSAVTGTVLIGFGLDLALSER
ncbi:MAG: hypothetical protein QOI83_3150 [Streptomycetaceae bacterium]|nr:hypothetical protein [Streptomycetaceae bacterium]